MAGSKNSSEGTQEVKKSIKSEKKMTTKQREKRKQREVDEQCRKDHNMKIDRWVCKICKSSLGVGEYFSSREKLDKHNKDKQHPHVSSK